MTDTKTPATDPNAPAGPPEQPTAPQAQAQAEPEPVKLSTKKALAVINDGVGDEDPDTAEALQAALYRFGAQDPSLEFPRSWQRVQRRIGVDPDKLNGVADAEQFGQFAERAGITVTK